MPSLTLIQSRKFFNHNLEDANKNVRKEDPQS